MVERASRRGEGGYSLERRGPRSVAGWGVDGTGRFAKAPGHGGGALAYERDKFYVFAQVSTAGGNVATRGNVATEAVPPDLARSLRVVLAGAGFKPDGPRSKKGAEGKLRLDPISR